MTSQALTLLNETKVVVSPEIFTLVAVDQAEWVKLIESPELSPRMTAPFMIFRDLYETTLLLDEIDFSKLKNTTINARVEGSFRLLTFDIELDFNVVGYLAEVTRVLSAAKIPVIVVSSFSRDHLLIKQDDLGKALKVLGEVVNELC